MDQAIKTNFLLRNTVFNFLFDQIWSKSAHLIIQSFQSTHPEIEQWASNNHSTWHLLTLLCRARSILSTKEYLSVIEGTAPAIVFQRFDSHNLSPPALSDGQVEQYTAHRAGERLGESNLCKTMSGAVYSVQCKTELAISVYIVKTAAIFIPTLAN